MKYFEALLRRPEKSPTLSTGELTKPTKPSSDGVSSVLSVPGIEVRRNSRLQGSTPTAPAQPADLTEGLYEIRVAWWTETLWFVPKDRDAAALVLEGIARCRIWTHAELASLTGPLEPDALRMIMLVRREFDGEVVESRPAARSSDPERPRKRLEL